MSAGLLDQLDAYFSECDASYNPCSLNQSTISYKVASSVTTPACAPSSAKSTAHLGCQAKLGTPLVILCR